MGQIFEFCENSKVLLLHSIAGVRIEIVGDARVRVEKQAAREGVGAEIAGANAGAKVQIKGAPIAQYIPARKERKFLGAELLYESLCRSVPK